MDDLGKRIYDLRKSLGLTLEDVGLYVGVGKSTVRKWEQGTIANMRRDKIKKLALALHTTPSYLMGWTDNPAMTAIDQGETDESSAFDLTPDEQDLILRFRKATQKEKEDVFYILREHKGATPTSSGESAG